MTASSCYLFRNTTTEHMAAIALLSHRRNMTAGEWLLQKDDHAEFIYLVEKGAVELVMPVSPEIEVPVAMVRPGDGCVGVSALIPPYVYTLSGRCKEDGLLTAIAAADLRKIFQSDPEFGCTVMANLAQRLIERLSETRQEIKLHFLNLIQAATF